MTLRSFWNYLYRFLLLLTGRLGGGLAIFLVNILIARNLGVDALGTFAIFVSMVAILTVCLPIGFNSVASFFATEYRVTERSGLLKGFIAAALKYILVSAGCLMVMLTIGYYFPLQTLPRDNLLFALLVVITAIGTSLLNLNSAILIGLNRQVTGSLPETLFRPLLVLIGVSTIFAANTSSDVYSVMIISAIASWTAVIIVIARALELKNIFQNNEVENDHPRWKKASYPWLATSLLWDYMIDLVLLLTSILSNVAEIAVLHICFRYRVLAGFGMRTIYMLLMPEITEHTIRKNFNEMNEKITQANMASLVYSIGVITVFIFLGNWLLGLFSENITYGQPVLIIVSFTMIIRALFGPATLILAVHNLHIATAVISSIGLLLAAGIILLFFAEYQLLAVAVAYTFANFFISATIWQYGKKQTGIDSSIFANIRLFSNKPA